MSPCTLHYVVPRLGVGNVFIIVPKFVRAISAMLKTYTTGSGEWSASRLTLRRAPWRDANLELSEELLLVVGRRS